MIGTKLGPYTLLAELGSGGMGTVYLADRSDAGDASRVALKVVHPHLLATPGLFQRFLREGEIGKRLRHRNVVSTLDIGGAESAGRSALYLAMEYVEGQTLRALLAELGRVPEDLCRHIGREIATGLVAIHEAGVVHRDLKPENVLITRDHAVKVMDLGVARLADEAVRLSQSGAFVGSVEYAAPEQFRGPGDVDARADLHALGVILYELATGQHPYRAGDFRAVMRRILDEAPRRPAEIHPQLSPFFEEFVLRLLQKDAASRFGSAAELSRILEDGERSAWWKERACSIRAATKRPLRRIRDPRETELVGRDAELARLRALYERAKSGDGQAAVVEGEAGIGKSRLVDEFVGLLQREGEDLNFLFGSYPPGGAATASGAFSTAYREHFGDEALGETLRDYLRATPVLVPAFAALLRGESAPTGAEALTKDSLQTVFVHATRALAAERTTIVLVDDLHFAPEEGRALFAALALAAPGHRVLLVGTMRPRADDAWLAGMELAGVARVPVGRLGPKDLVRLLAGSLRSERVAEDLSGRIAVKSDGNPFFVFEILRSLRDGKLLTRSGDGTWAASGVIGEIQVPSSVLELVNARVAELDVEERDLLDVAACWGFEFDPLLVGDVLGLARIPLLKRLGQIERRHRLVRAVGVRYAFDHHQVQEALYGSLSPLLRSEYHAALARALEAREGAASRDPVELEGSLCVDLAGHFLQGGQTARALRFLDAALGHLEKSYMNEAAVRLADAALEAPSGVTGAARAGVLLRKASRLDVLGRPDDEGRVLAEAALLADAAGDAALRARVQYGLGSHLFRVARYDAAETALLSAVELAQAAGDRVREARAQACLASVLHALGRRDEADRANDGRRAAARESGDVASQLAADMWGAFITFESVGDILSSVGRLVETARAAGDRRTEAVGISHIGTALRLAGRFEEARVQYEASLAVARTIGDRRLEATVIGALAGVCWGIGNYAEEQAHLERHLALTRELGDRRASTLRLSDLGEIRHRLGDRDAAARLTHESLELARSISYPHGEGAAIRRLGLMAYDVEDLDEALRLTRAAEQAFRRVDSRRDLAESLVTLGAIHASAGDPAAARERLGEALDVGRAVGLPNVLVLSEVRLALVSGTGAGAAADAMAEYGPRLGCEERMEARFLLWKATRGREHLAEARRFLAHLVAHAPPDRREPMVANVRVHREIAAAAHEADL